MGGSDIRAGKAFVELYLKEGRFTEGLRNAQRRLRAFGAGMAAIGKSVSLASTAVAGMLSVAVMSASRLEEAVSKFNVVFGVSSDTVREWSDNFAKAIGRSKRQIVEFMAGSQDLFVPLGFDDKSATDMSKQVTQLAIDLASFNNKADSDVLRDLHAALTGSGETMKKYGVIVSEAAVKQELLNRGLDPSKADDRAKVMARLAIILRGTTAAQGDAMRTSGSFANQTKALRAQLEDFGAELGGVVTPLLQPLIKDTTEIIISIGKWTKENRSLIVSFLRVAAGVAAAGVAFYAVGKAITIVSAALGALRTASLFLLANPITLPIVAVTALLGALAYTIGEVTSHTAMLTRAQQAALEAGDQQRKSAQLQMERLEQLAEKQALSSEEMKEAQSIIGELEGTYGSLGLSVDRTTGAILGLSEAQSRLNKVMREAALAELDAAMAEVYRNIGELIEELETASWWKVWRKGAESIGEEIDVAVKKLDALRLRYSALQGGSDAAITGGKIQSKDDTLAGKILTDAAAMKQQEEWEREFQRLKLQGIEDEFERRIALIDEEYAYRIKKAEEAGLETATLEQMHIEEIAQSFDEMNRRKAGEQKRLEESESRRKATIEDRKGDIAYDTEAARIDATMQGTEKELALLRLRQKREREELKKSGLDPALLAAKHGFEEKAIQRAQALQSSVRPQGTFSASAIPGMGGSGGVQERIARAAEKSEKHEQAMATVLDRLLSELKRFNMEASP